MNGDLRFAICDLRLRKRTAACSSLKTILALLALIALSAVALSAADQPPPVVHTQPTQQQFANRPNVLYYEGFEHEGATVFFEGGGVADKGAASPPVPGKPAPAVAEQDPAAPSAHCFKLGETTMGDGKIQKVSQAKLNLGPAQVAIPNGLNPSQIKVQFGFWAEIPGELSLHLVLSKGEAKLVRQNTKVKTWFKVDFGLADPLDDKKKPVDKDAILTAIEVHYKPKLRVDFPLAFLDDFIIVVNSTPAAELPFVEEAAKLQADLEQTIEKNGFKFSLPLQDKLRALSAKAQERKHKVVLVVAPSSAETSALCKELTAAQAKVKESFVFTPAVDAGSGVPIGGVDDMRQLLLYNLQRSDAAFVLLCFSPAEAANNAATALSLRIMLERTLGAGALPLVCAPPTPAGDKVGVFDRSVDSNCTFVGVPWIDAGFALKDKGGYESGQLNAQAISSVAALAVGALKRMREAAGL